MKNIKPYAAWFITFLLLLFVSTGCEARQENGETGRDGNPDIEVFCNSRKQTRFESIELEETQQGITVRIHYPDRQVRYIGEAVDNEIIVHLESGEELHFFRNGQWELRMFIVTEEYQPEDIEWTFYRNRAYSESP